MGRPKIDLSESRWTVTSVELAHILGVHITKLRDFSNAGMPKRGRGAWHLPECVQWVLGRTDHEKLETDLDIKERRAALYQAQEEHKRLEILRAAGALIPCEVVERAVLTYTSYFIGLLEALPGRTDLDPDAERRLEREILAAREDLIDALRTLEQALAEDPEADYATTEDGELGLGREEAEAAGGDC